MTAERLRAFRTTIFTEMSALAAQTGAINLGQGFSGYRRTSEIIDAQLAVQSDGRVATQDELEAIARACVEHHLIAVTDEVHEHLVFDGEHGPGRPFSTPSR